MTAQARTAPTVPRAGERAAAPARAGRVLPPWAPMASLALHAAALAATLLLLQRPPRPAVTTEQGVEFIWDEAPEAELATGEPAPTPGLPPAVEAPPSPEAAAPPSPPPAPPAAPPPAPTAAVPPPQAMAALPPPDRAEPPPAPPIAVPPPRTPAAPREAMASPPLVAPPPPEPLPAPAATLVLPLPPPDSAPPVTLPPPPAPAPEAVPEAAPEAAEALPLPPPPPPPPPSAAPPRQAPTRQAQPQAAPSQAPAQPPAAAPSPAAPGPQLTAPGGSRALGAVSPPGPLDGVRNPEPDYPYSSRQRGEQGTVAVLLRIAETGQVVGVELVRSSGHPALDDSARQTVLRWRFRPAMRDGVPVVGSIRTSIHFTLSR